MTTEPSWFVPDWPLPANVRALQTVRGGGASCGPWAGFNLGDHVGDDPAAVAANRERLSAAVGGRIHWLRQVHGVHVCDLDAASGEEQEIPEADAALTRRRGQACAIMTADCLPLLFCEREGAVVAAAHAGWRGLLGGVIEATLSAMAVPAGQVSVWLGPAIGPAAFEVGDEVRAAFVAGDPGAAACFTAHGSGKHLADLYALARRRLRQSGVVAIHGGGECTLSAADRYFSYRRDGVTGRMATLIWRI